jgi:hypothetical protein
MTDKSREPSGTSLPLELFTFDTFHAWTPSMAGASRAELFSRLPSSLRAQAWADLVRQLEDER